MFSAKQSMMIKKYTQRNKKNNNNKILDTG